MKMKVIFCIAAILAVATAVQQSEMPDIGDYVFEHGALIAEAIGINITSAEHEELFGGLRENLNQNSWKAQYLEYENPFFGEHLLTGVNEDEYLEAVKRDELLAETGAASGEASGCATGGSAPRHMSQTNVFVHVDNNMCITGEAFYIEASIHSYYQSDCVTRSSINRRDTEGCCYKGNFEGLGTASCGCACRKANMGIFGHRIWSRESGNGTVGFNCMCNTSCTQVGPLAAIELPFDSSQTYNWLDLFKSFAKPILCDCIVPKLWGGWNDAVSRESAECNCAVEIAFAFAYGLVKTVVVTIEGGTGLQILKTVGSAGWEIISDSVGCAGATFFGHQQRERLKTAIHSLIGEAIVTFVIELVAGFVPLTGWVKILFSAKKYYNVFMQCKNDFWNVIVKITRWFQIGFCFDGTKFNAWVLLDAVAGAIGCGAGTYWCGSDAGRKFKFDLAEVAEEATPALNLAEIKERAVSTWDSDIAEALRFFTADTTRDHTAGIAFLNGLRDYVRAL